MIEKRSKLWLEKKFLQFNVQIKTDEKKLENNRLKHTLIMSRSILYTSKDHFQCEMETCTGEFFSEPRRDDHYRDSKHRNYYPRNHGKSFL